MNNSSIERKYYKLSSNWFRTSNPTTFSTKIMTGGCINSGMISRILRKEEARASADCFCRPKHKLSSGINYN
ncbi:hypothetical protein HanXRQr2_Chr13g0587771 [Helianthus annuus]|uniref:Uncharacterized protein n=1 Tax=Helianthus annuus TaxID=4232 RepID=A0A9K3EHI6_HELAN|nr:hypothetical protein HanXRQr2_Chr13g0587771 [Helianthus annuus]KAJ0849181.1 hypothetical protein HanPSC8_Chr13g0565951 [Helianthus annuus]